MDEKLRDEMRDHAWKYFTLHAEQRLKTFNFFLILCAFIAGGLLTIVKDAKDPRIGSPVALLLPILAFVFWKLDKRNKQLIAHAQDAIMFLEDQTELPPSGDVPHVLKILRSEEYNTSRDKPWTYSTCFNAVFWVFAIAGTLFSAVLMRIGQ